VCVVDAQGNIVREAKVASEPEALLAFFASLGFAVKRIGLEAGPLSQWLQSGLKCAGLEVVLLETRHVKAALSAMTGAASQTSRELRAATHPRRGRKTGEKMTRGRQAVIDVRSPAPPAWSTANGRSAV
jgi:transposase